METEGRAKAPWHLWLVGALALLWNAFGCYDYVMTRTTGAAYINDMMHTTQGDAIMAYIDAFPLWASAAWALGVWGGLIGAILLLARSRHAVAAFAISMIGAIVGIAYQLMTPSGIAEMNEGINQTMPYVIVAITVALFLYARSQHARGVLA